MQDQREGNYAYLEHHEGSCCYLSNVTFNRFMLNNPPCSQDEFVSSTTGLLFCLFSPMGLVDFVGFGMLKSCSYTIQTSQINTGPGLIRLIVSQAGRNPEHMRAMMFQLRKGCFFLKKLDSMFTECDKMLFQCPGEQLHFAHMPLSHLTHEP